MRLLLATKSQNVAAQDVHGKKRCPTRQDIEQSTSGLSVSYGARMAGSERGRASRIGGNMQFRRYFKMEWRLGLER